VGQQKRRKKRGRSGSGDQLEASFYAKTGRRRLHTILSAPVGKRGRSGSGDQLEAHSVVGPTETPGEEGKEWKWGSTGGVFLCEDWAKTSRHNFIRSSGEANQNETARAYVVDGIE